MILFYRFLRILALLFLVVPADGLTKAAKERELNNCPKWAAFQAYKLDTYLIRVPKMPAMEAFYIYLPVVLRSELPGAHWSAYESHVLELVNQERANDGCAVGLTPNETLHQAAYNHSADMLARDFFDHTNPDGKNPGSRLTDLGYAWQAYGENIAAGYPSPEAVMAGWMSSPGHRANILNCNYTEIGIGHVYAADDPGEYPYNHYWTQVFARPER